jgi:structural maintenance of chromosome 2
MEKKEKEVTKTKKEKEVTKTKKEKERCVREGRLLRRKWRS